MTLAPPRKTAKPTKAGGVLDLKRNPFGFPLSFYFDLGKNLGMERICDLTPAQLGGHAVRIFAKQGAGSAAGRLTYHALACDPGEPHAILCLYCLLNRGPGKVYAAAALEYGISPSTPMSDTNRKMLDDQLFFSKWEWGFARHNSGKPQLYPAEFERRDDFEVDEAGYREWFNELLEPAGSVEEAFYAALRFAGVMSGLLKHKAPDSKHTSDEFLKGDVYETTPAYAEWLGRSAADELGEIK